MDEVDALLADVARWTADARSEEAARSRARERWLRQQAEEDARFAGLALDLAERATALAVRTTSGRTLHGRFSAVARDFCVLHADGGTAVLLTFAAVAAVRPEPGARAGAAAGDRAAPLSLTLADLLAALAAERPRVRVVVEGGGEAVSGELWSVGADVATIRLEGDDRPVVYVRLEAVREVTLTG